MTVEDQRNDFLAENGNMDRFPVGLRILAVDDDPICLKVLENLLRKCQYHVTTTNQAVQALKMLRENRNKFDLVISDVNMPDMDGFKLLELVGLEMDLPVIMLSAHSDVELVMKGVTHGACDYMLKPVRIEELKNIWQHVLRRKKSYAKDRNKCSNEIKACNRTLESAKGVQSEVGADNGKPDKKRKDQDEDEEGGEEDDICENDDTSTQKKPRVVWSGELHRKFISSVNQLGYEKAVPKKILDMMNVEGLTRENVASHLQKYRQYLKKMCTKETQQGAMLAAFGGKDTSFMHIGSLDRFAMAGSGRLSNATFSSYPSGGMLGRLNSTAGLSLHGITSSGMIQQGTQNSNSSFKLHSAPLPANQTTSIFYGISTSSEIIQPHQEKHITSIKEFNSIDDASSFTVSTSFPDARVTVGSSRNYDISVSRNPLMLQGHEQQIHGRGEFGDQSLTNPESLDCGMGVSHMLGHGQSNENWQASIQLSKFPSNASVRGIYPPDDLTITSAQPDNSNFPVDFSSTSVYSSSQLDLRGKAQCYEKLIGSIAQAMNDRPRQQWGEDKQDYHGDLHFSVRNSLVSGDSVADPLRWADQKNADCLGIGSSLTNQLNNGTPSFIQHSVDISTMDTWMDYEGKNLIDPSKLQNGFTNSYNSLDDIANAMMKQEENQSIREFEFDAQSLGSCI